MTRRPNGEGTIVHRSDGRWFGRLPVWENGKLQRKPVYGKTQAEVARKLRELKRQLDQGLPAPDGTMTVAQLAEQFLEAKRGTIKDRTLLSYRLCLENHVVPAIGRVKVAKLEPRDLQALWSAKLDAGLAPRSVRNLHAVTRHMLTQAARWGITARNVAALVDPPKVPHHEMQTLDAAQARRFLDACHGDRLEALFLLAVTTGMRQGELLGLRWQNVDLDAGVLQVREALWKGTFTEPKTKAGRRKIRLTGRAVTALRDHKERQDWERIVAADEWDYSLGLVFTNDFGRPLTISNMIKRHYQPLLAKAGCPRLRFHDLRHTAATLMLSQGLPVKVVSEMLGHSQASVTLDVYAHATPTMHDQAVKVMEDLLASAR
jgi:integrase